MPVEIKELVIRAVVVKSEDKSKTTVSRAAKATKALKISDDNDVIVEQCVAEVMRLLRRSKER